jgi:hypothetical protein
MKINFCLASDALDYSRIARHEVDRYERSLSHSGSELQKAANSKHYEIHPV